MTETVFDHRPEAGSPLSSDCIYHIRLLGQAAEGEINALSPLQVQAAGCAPDATCLTARSDQSGLVGMIRYLHGLGFVILSIERVEIAKGM